MGGSSSKPMTQPQIFDTDVHDAKTESIRDETEPKEPDLLSQLFDDCILDVLARLDREDLKNVATLSRKMNNFANILLSKTNAEYLLVTQVNPKKFQFTVIFKEEGDKKERAYGVEMTEKTGYELLQLETWSIASTPYNPQQQVISRDIIHRATSLFDRFEFEKCIFNSVSVDDHFLNFVEQVTPESSLKYLNIVWFAFDKSLKNEGRERFLSILLSSKIPWITLFFLSDDPFIDERFLRSYSECKQEGQSVVSELQLIIKREDNKLKNSLIRPGADFEETLLKYDVIEVPRIIANTDWLLPAILKRLRQNRQCGKWSFGMTRDITLNELTDALGSDLTIDSSDKDAVKIIATEWGVQIKTSRNKSDRKLWKLEAYFYRTPAYQSRWGF